jgi:hypothetical protein
MKEIIISICFIGMLLKTVAQTSIPIKIVRLDSVTAFGKPDGQQVTREIDDDGGTIVSDDGKLELIFPKGALSKKKKITIQPVTNLAANGRGKTYNMEPSGLQFNKPVQIIFHYSDNEMQGTLAELKGIAMQDDKGKWSALQNIILDSINKTITSEIFHFSSYSSFDKMVLKPASARVKVEKTAEMVIQFADSPAEESDAARKNEDYLPPLPPTIPSPEWSVNGARNGSRNFGWITNSVGAPGSATFNAPANVPDDNPVAVSVHLKGLKFKFGKKVFDDLQLVSRLLIYDRAYRIKMAVWMDNSEDGQCTMRVEDRGEFTVVMDGNHTRIKEVLNENMRLTFNPCPKCTPTWVNQPVCRGPIDVIGTKRLEVLPASLPNQPFAHLRIFLQHGNSPMPDIRTPCPMRQLTSLLPQPILPPLIEFDANNEDEQTITLSELTHGGFKNAKRQGMIINIKRISE